MESPSMELQRVAESMSDDVRAFYDKYKDHVADKKIVAQRDVAAILPTLTRPLASLSSGNAHWFLRVKALQEINTLLTKERDPEKIGLVGPTLIPLVVAQLRETRSTIVREVTNILTQLYTLCGEKFEGDVEISICGLVQVASDSSNARMAKDTMRAIFQNAPANQNTIVLISKLDDKELRNELLASIINYAATHTIEENVDIDLLLGLAKCALDQEFMNIFLRISHDNFRICFGRMAEYIYRELPTSASVSQRASAIKRSQVSTPSISVHNSLVYSRSQRDSMVKPAITPIQANHVGSSSRIRDSPASIAPPSINRISQVRSPPDNIVNIPLDNKDLEVSNRMSVHNTNNMIGSGVHNSGRNSDSLHSVNNSRLNISNLTGSKNEKIPEVQMYEGTAGPMMDSINTLRVANVTKTALGINDNETEVKFDDTRNKDFEEMIEKQHTYAYSPSSFSNSASRSQLNPPRSVEITEIDKFIENSNAVSQASFSATSGTIGQIKPLEYNSNNMNNNHIMPKVEQRPGNVRKFSYIPFEESASSPSYTMSTGRIPPDSIKSPSNLQTVENGTENYNIIANSKSPYNTISANDNNNNNNNINNNINNNNNILSGIANTNIQMMMRDNDDNNIINNNSSIKERTDIGTENNELIQNNVYTSSNSIGNQLNMDTELGLLRKSPSNIQSYDEYRNSQLLKQSQQQSQLNQQYPEENELSNYYNRFVNNSGYNNEEEQVINRSYNNDIINREENINGGYNDEDDDEKFKDANNIQDVLNISAKFDHVIKDSEFRKDVNENVPRVQPEENIIREPFFENNENNELKEQTQDYQDPDFVELNDDINSAPAVSMNDLSQSIKQYNVSDEHMYELLLEENRKYKQQLEKYNAATTEAARANQPSRSFIGTMSPDYSIYKSQSPVYDYQNISMIRDFNADSSNTNLLDMNGSGRYGNTNMNNNNNNKSFMALDAIGSLIGSSPAQLSRSTISRYQREFDEKMRQIQDAKYQLSDAIYENEKLKLRLQTAKDIVQENMERKIKISQSINELRDKLQRGQNIYTNTYQSAEKQMIEYSMDLKKMVDSCKLLEDKIKVNNQLLTTLKDELKSAEATKRGLTQEYERLKVQLNEEEVAKKDLENKINVNRSRTETYGKETLKLIDKIESIHMSSDRDGVEKTPQQKLDDAKKNLEQKKREINQIPTLKMELEKMKTEISSIKVQLFDLGDSAATKEKIEEEIKVLENEVAKYKELDTNLIKILNTKG